MNELQQNQNLLRDAWLMTEMRESLAEQKRQARYYHTQMWICFFGWSLTAVLFLVWG